MNAMPVAFRIRSVTGCRIALGSGEVSAETVDGDSARLTATAVTSARAARSPSTRASTAARRLPATTTTATTTSARAAT